MGWYSLYKWFRTFRKSKYINYITWYKQYLYDTWFDSLSVEDKTKEINRQAAIAKAKDRDLRTSLAKLGAMHLLLHDMSMYSKKHTRRACMQLDSSLESLLDE